jgi:hypothetical protein
MSITSAANGSATLKKGDRVAVLGHGIAVVDEVGDRDVMVVLGTRLVFRIARTHIVLKQDNLRWECGSQHLSSNRFLPARLIDSAGLRYPDKISTSEFSTNGRSKGGGGMSSKKHFLISKPTDITHLRESLGARNWQCYHCHSRSCRVAALSSLQEHSHA